MKRRVFKKWANIAGKLHRAEICVSLGGFGGSTKPTDRDRVLAKKLRKRYNKFGRNPKYINELYRRMEKVLTFEP